MANVILTERERQSGRRQRTARRCWRPSRRRRRSRRAASAAEVDPPDGAGVRLRAGPAWRSPGGVASQHRGADRDLRRGEPAQLRRRQRRARPCGSAPTSTAATATARRSALLEAMDGGGVQLAIGARGQPGLHACPRPPASRPSSRRCRSRSRPRSILDETAALCDLLLPNHHALERWDDLRPRRGVTGLMQPVMEPVFKTHGHRRRAAEGVPEGWRRARRRSTRSSWEAHLKAQWRRRRVGELKRRWRAGAAARRGLRARPRLTPVPARRVSQQA